MKSNTGRRYSRNVLLAIFLTFVTLITTSCVDQKTITTETPEHGAKQYMEALQKLDLNALRSLTCSGIRSHVNAAMLENGAGFEFGIHSNHERDTSDISALTYTTIWINSDNDIAHVRIGGTIRYTDSDEVFTQDTIRSMKKENNVWMECGVINQ